MPNIKVRFAPSPTGPLHIGGARSALFNYLFARHEGGTFLVRTEDTDQERSRPEYEREILDSLRWLGITWDEGIDVGGENGPYRQMERLAIYQEYAARLIEQGHAYYCFCSEDELEAERQELIARGETPRYLGKCRDLSPQEQKERLAAGQMPTVRFRVPEGRQIVVNDLVRGTVSFPSDNMGDFIIMKSDGIPTYNFAVVLDDHLMGVTHVLRAEEHLSNTPRQLLIYEALGFTPPAFGHISLILGSDRQKMSKRHGATSLAAYREMGYLPEALVNFLALMGWSAEGEREILSLAEMEREFTIDKVAKNPAVFDLDKLNHINREYLKRKDDQTLGRLLRPFLEKRWPGGLPPVDSPRYIYLVQGIREYLTCLSEAPAYADCFLERPELDEGSRQTLAAGDTREVLSALAREMPEEMTPETAKSFLKSFIKTRKLSGKQVYLPLRIALTGRDHGPETPFLLAAMGAGEVRERIAEAVKDR